MFNRPHLSSVHAFRNFGMTPFIYVGDLYFVYVRPPNNLVFCLKILSVLQIQNIAHSADEEHIIRDAYRQYYLSNLMLPNAVRTVKAEQPQLMFPLHGPFISPKTTHYISPFFVTFLLDPLIIHDAFSNPILLLALLAPFVKKQDETGKHVFWYCSRWKEIPLRYPTLMRLFCLVGT